MVYFMVLITMQLVGLFLYLFRIQERDNVYHAGTPYNIMCAQRTIFFRLIFPFTDSLKLGYFRLINMFTSIFMLLFGRAKKGIEKVHKEYHF